MSADFSFAVPFTDDAVLQQAPAAASIYGLVSAGSSVQLFVTDDATRAAYSVPAAVLPYHSGAVGGSANPLCQQRCLDAGFCAVGQVSSCVKPSCAMGCILAGRTASVSACKAQCTLASANWNASCNQPTAACNQGNPALKGGGCDFVVPSPPDRHHSPGETTQNETFQMCADRQEGWSSPPVLTNGTQCTSCNVRPECAMGCGFWTWDVINGRGGAHTRLR